MLSITSNALRQQVMNTEGSQVFPEIDSENYLAIFYNRKSYSPPTGKGSQTGS